jgi:prophage maintenance system killer protein
VEPIPVGKPRIANVWNEKDRMLVPLKASAPVTNPELVPESALIGNHSLQTLIQKIRSDIGPHIEKTLCAWFIGQQDPNSGIVSAPNTVMLAALESVHKALRDCGFNLQSPNDLPDNVHLLVKEALSSAKESPALSSRVPIDSIAGQKIKNFDIDKINFRLADIRQLQQQGFEEQTPFKEIAPEQHWRMCIDPKIFLFIERHINHASGNPLLPFIFDSEQAYLHGMLKAWSVSMKNLNHPLDSKLLSILHSACEPLSGTDDEGFHEKSVVFKVKMGENMSVAGKAELLDFARELRNYLPGYGVVANLKTHPHFIRLPGQPPRDDYEALWRAAEPDQAGVVVRPPIPGPALKAIIARLFQQYEKNMHDTPDEKLHHIVRLCQQLERLHPFGDGNCRTFGILLINNLLTRNGLPLTMMEDPNLLDAYSLAECVAKVREGQAQVQQWARSRPVDVRRLGVKTRLQARLEAQPNSR